LDKSEVGNQNLSPTTPPPIHSTLLHELGVPLKAAQEQLGHATIGTTLKVYTHAIPETHKKAIENLEHVLFPNVPKYVEKKSSGVSLIQ
jgi:integrase